MNGVVRPELSSFPLATRTTAGEENQSEEELFPLIISVKDEPLDNYAVQEATYVAKATDNCETDARNGVERTDVNGSFAGKGSFAVSSPLNVIAPPQQSAIVCTTAVSRPSVIPNKGVAFSPDGIPKKKVTGGGSPLGIVAPKNADEFRPYESNGFGIAIAGPVPDLVHISDIPKHAAQTNKARPKCPNSENTTNTNIPENQPADSPVSQIRLVPLSRLMQSPVRTEAQLPTLSPRPVIRHPTTVSGTLSIRPSSAVSILPSTSAALVRPSPTAALTRPPSSAALTRPSSTAALTRPPSSAALIRPSPTAALTRPPSAAFVRPSSNAALTRPPSAALVRPSLNATRSPSSAALTQPSSAALIRPSSTAARHASSMASARPSSSAPPFRISFSNASQGPSTVITPVRTPIKTSASLSAIGPGRVMSNVAPAMRSMHASAVRPASGVAPARPVYASTPVRQNIVSAVQPSWRHVNPVVPAKTATSEQQRLSLPPNGSFRTTTSSANLSLNRFPANDLVVSVVPRPTAPGLLVRTQTLSTATSVSKPVAREKDVLTITPSNRSTSPLVPAGVKTKIGKDIFITYRNEVSGFKTQFPPANKSTSAAPKTNLPAAQPVRKPVPLLSQMNINRPVYPVSGRLPRANDSLSVFKRKQDALLKSLGNNFDSRSLGINFDPRKTADKLPPLMLKRTPSVASSQSFTVVKNAGHPQPDLNIGANVPQSAKLLEKASTSGALSTTTLSAKSNGTAAVMETPRVIPVASLKKKFSNHPMPKREKLASPDDGKSSNCGAGGPTLSSSCVTDSAVQQASFLNQLNLKENNSVAGSSKPLIPPLIIKRKSVLSTEDQPPLKMKIKLNSSGSLVSEPAVQNDGLQQFTVGKSEPLDDQDFNERYLSSMNVIEGDLLICDVCHKLFPSGESLQCHMEFYHGREHKCTMCPFTAKKEFLLTRHVLEMHTNNGVVWDCIECTKSFNNKSAWSVHRLREHGVGRNIQCKECGHYLKTQDGYNKHYISSHSREFPHKCPIESCGKGFFVPSKVAEHVELCHAVSLSEEKPSQVT